LLLFGAAGCGRKAVPLPPFIEVPETIVDLVAQQDGTEVALTWSYPKLTRAGRALTDLARVEVWRLEVPPGQESTGSGPGAEDLRRQLMLSRGLLLSRLEGDSLRDATRGDTLVERDQLPELVPGRTPSTIWYAVRSRRRDGTASALSNIVALRPKPVPAAVTGLHGEPGKEGIALTWSALSGASVRLERRAEVGSWQLLTPKEFSEKEFLDRTARQGATWRFRVRAVADDVWGPPGAEIEVAYPDLYPPASPAGLICLPEPALVRLRWDAAPEAGAFFKVLRRTAGSPRWDHLAERVDQTSFSDDTPPSAVLEYAVKTVDDAGNQSEAATCTVRTGS